MKNHIELKQISKEFYQADKKFTLFTDVSYTFTQGQSYALTGVSGTGKSTLLHILAGIEKPTSGTVLYDAVSYVTLSAEKQRNHLNKHLGIMFQYAYLINELSVSENVALKARIAGISSELATQQADELLNQVGLFHKADALPATLSGGEQQRVALARALMLRPPFIVADEPTAHLDEDNKKIVIELLLKCSTLFGSALIISSHDPFIVEKMQHKLTIHQGKLCHE